MLLSLIVFLPLFFAVIIGLWPNERTIKILAFVLSIIEFFVSLILFKYFDTQTSSLQMVELYKWIDRFGISYFLAIDGLSFWLVLLTTFLTPIVLLGAWETIQHRIKFFLISMFVLETAMLGSFLALDAILFYLFWELSLIPMYFIIGIWGGSRKIYATIKFFIYTMLGSVLMLVAIFYMMYLTQQVSGNISSSILDFYNVQIPFIKNQFFSLQTLLFFAFALAFSIKVPIFPFHTWLPDAHVEAPTPGSVILAGVMLKMGTYGFMRWTIPLFPDAAENWAWIFLTVGVIGIIYGALVAMVQPDIKKLVAYSSVSHMGYVLVGLFSFSLFGVSGGLYQMLNHGISTGALFLLVGMIYERTHSREISKYGGLTVEMPIFSILFFIITLSSIGVPLTNGFIGEFMILLGLFDSHKFFAAFSVTGVVLGAAYMLWMFKKVFFGPRGELVSSEHHPLHDLRFREIFLITPLIVLVFWMGLFPNHFLKYSKSSLDHWVNDRNQYQLSINHPAEEEKNEATKVSER